MTETNTEPKVDETTEESPLFREQALSYYQRGLQGEGEPLRLSPHWINLSYWLLLFFFLFSLIFITFGKINEYAAGTAVVRITGRIDLSAINAGKVVSVEVSPGEQVSAGQALIRLNDETERAELARISGEYNLQLVSSLKDPLNESAQQTLSLLRQQKESVEARIAERVIKAPRAGIVSDIRIRPGQFLKTDQVAISLFEAGARMSIIAMIPGHYRPQLQPGLELRIEPKGYRYAYQHLVIDTIGDEVVGPNEVRRYLGNEIADSITINGPVVLVESTLNSDSFQADGIRYKYFDGMPVDAEVRVRSERIIFAFIPWLKALVENNGR